jgi:hypothetical protein
MTRRRKSKRVKLVLKMAAIFLPFIFSPNIAGASNVNFSQSILPAKIVYLDDKSEIKNIWSNVSAKDEIYIIKFFDLQKNIELGMDGYLWDSYQQFEIEKANYNFGEKEISATVDFVRKNNSLEEVQTFV